MVTKESEIARTIQRLIVEKSKGAISSQGTEIKKGIDAKHQLSTWVGFQVPGEGLEASPIQNAQDVVTTERTKENECDSWAPIAK